MVSVKSDIQYWIRPVRQYMHRYDTYVVIVIDFRKGSARIDFHQHLVISLIGSSIFFKLHRCHIITVEVRHGDGK